MADMKNEHLDLSMQLNEMEYTMIMELPLEGEHPKVSIIKNRCGEEDELAQENEMREWIASIKFLSATLKERQKRLHRMLKVCPFDREELKLKYSSSKEGGDQLSWSKDIGGLQLSFVWDTSINPRRIDLTAKLKDSAGLCLVSDVMSDIEPELVDAFIKTFMENIGEYFSETLMSMNAAVKNNTQTQED